jgi:hypothetical protein
MTEKYIENKIKKDLVSLNLKEYIYIKLNKNGIKIANSACLGRIPQCEYKGYYKFQLWKFINIFGVYLNIGISFVCDTEIIFERELLKEIKL